MRITLTMNGASVGYMDYQIWDPWDLIGQLLTIATQPPQLGTVIEHKINTNAYKVTVSGGFSVTDLSTYWDGVVMTLNSIKEDLPGFDYIVPSDEDPIKNRPESEDDEGVH